jgi:hypothetical protein
VANLLVLIEVADGRPLPGSLEALGQARRIGSTLGATVYALAPCAEAPGYGDDDLIAVLSRHGADKVLLATDGAYGAPPRFGTHGPLLALACASLPPSLLVAAATDGARDLMPRVAARLGAAYLADAWIGVEGEELTLFEGSGEGACRLDGGELEFPVVALIPPGRYHTARGDDEAEVEVLPGAAAGADFEDLGDEAAPSVAVLGDGEAAAQLAAALGAATGGGAPLVVELAPRCAPGDATATVVTIGEGASSCAHARYAVDGDAATIARRLAIAIANADAEANVPAFVADEKTQPMPSGPIRTDGGGEP